MKDTTLFSWDNGTFIMLVVFGLVIIGLIVSVLIMMNSIKKAKRKRMSNWTSSILKNNLAELTLINFHFNRFGVKSPPKRFSSSYSENPPSKQYTSELPSKARMCVHSV
jgi:energy-converting hydrogenase Eha subunit A